MADVRAIRVFVSSTFRDFIAERDRLARFAFPAVRRLCEERGVVFTDVDLRWGITDEQVAEGRVLPICLEEIDRSRPFFIGLLGERYGWIPESIEPQLIEREPWLAENLERSVTELEIVHGVLSGRSPGMASRACFYLRDPATIDDVPPERKADYACETDDARIKLQLLKARIRASGLPVREGFRTPEELSELVLADLTNTVEHLFPKEEIPDSFARERLTHETLAAELADGFVERPTLLAALDAHACGGGPPLLVTGATGCGKSALLAAWSLRHASTESRVYAPRRRWYELLLRTGRRRPETRRATLIVHFCGASATSADWLSICRRVAAELAQSTGVQAHLPGSTEKFKAAFHRLLSQAASVSPFVLVVDGVDQLEDRDSALDLAFLPTHLPAGCRLILSAVSGTRPAGEVVRRGWATLEVPPLSAMEIPTVVSSLLARKRKALSPGHLARLCDSPAASNPLFLSVLVDELSVVGSHESLDATIDLFGKLSSVEGLYRLVLERWEGDYDARPGLVADTMRALCGARRGLSERELLDVLGSTLPLPQASLAPLLLAAGRQLATRSGLIGFAHSLLGEAVRHRYIPDKETEWAVHGQLAQYFQTLERPAARTVEELPWQLMQAREWDALGDLLADLSFLRTCWASDENAVRRYWVCLETYSEWRIGDVYHDAITAPAGHPDELIALVNLLRSTEYLALAWRLSTGLAKRLQDAGDYARLAEVLGEQASINLECANPEDAMTALGTQARIYRHLGDEVGLSRALFAQARCLDQSEVASSALGLLKRQERASRRLRDWAGVALSLGEQASIRGGRGRMRRAIALLRTQEAILRQNGESRAVAVSLARQAVLLNAKGRRDDAAALTREASAIFRGLGILAELAAFLDKESALLAARGELRGALAAMEEAERVYREIDDQTGLVETLAARAEFIAFTLQKPKDAVAVAKLALESATWDGWRTEWLIEDRMAEVKELAVSNSSATRWRRALCLVASLVLAGGFVSVCIGTFLPARNVAWCLCLAGVCGLMTGALWLGWLQPFGPGVLRLWPRGSLGQAAVLPLLVGGSLLPFIGWRSWVTEDSLPVELLATAPISASVLFVAVKLLRGLTVHDSDSGFGLLARRIRDLVGHDPDAGPPALPAERWNARIRGWLQGPVMLKRHRLGQGLNAWSLTLICTVGLLLVNAWMVAAIHGLPPFGPPMFYTTHGPWRAYPGLGGIVDLALLLWLPSPVLGLAALLLRPSLRAAGLTILSAAFWEVLRLHVGLTE